MAKKTDEPKAGDIRGSTEATPSEQSSESLADEPTTQTAEPLAPPSTEPLTAAAPAEPTTAPTTHDYDVTIKNTSGQEQTVVAKGIDAGLAAQDAMRRNPGWTADHSRTREHEDMSSR